jgi:hypothetical protein
MARDPIRRLLDSEEGPDYAQVAFDLSDDLARLAKVKGVNPKIQDLAKTLRTLLAREKISRAMKGDSDEGFQLLKILKQASGYGDWEMTKDDEIEEDDLERAAMVAGVEPLNPDVVSSYSFVRDFKNRSELSSLHLLVWPGYFFVNMISTDRVTDGGWDFHTLAELKDAIAEWAHGD